MTHVQVNHAGRSVRCHMFIDSFRYSCKNILICLYGQLEKTLLKSQESLASCSRSMSLCFPEVLVDGLLRPVPQSNSPDETFKYLNTLIILS